MSTVNKKIAKDRRHKRIRKSVKGTTERPRLAVFRSNKYLYAQVIDDVQGVTLVSASSVEKEMREQFAGRVNLAVAEAVGKMIGERAKAKGIEKVVFDRGGFIYHGRIKSLADAAREAGLEF